MKQLFFIAWPVLALSTSAFNCHKMPAQSNAVVPYPPLSEQRAVLAAKQTISNTHILESTQLLTDLEYFASDSCGGRKPGTVGHARAEARILERMRSAGLDSFGTSLLQPFAAKNNSTGKNVVGWMKGTAHPEQYLVVSAHYDHLGITESGTTYYGADDNASGAACLLALAAYFKTHPPARSIIFAALDKEETGLEGAYAFVAQAAASGLLASVKINLNLDMIARSDKNEIFVCGIRHHPAYRAAVDSVQNKTNVHVLMGHDSGSEHEDWTMQSDQGAFFKNGVPFLYIGVEDHADYHQPTDTYSRINQQRYLENCNMIAELTRLLDHQG